MAKERADVSDNLRIPPRVRSLQVRAVAVLLVIGVINFLDRSALSVANPLIRQDMGLSIAEMGLLLSAFAWAYAFCQLPGGALVDRVGPRRLLGWALIVWSLAQAAVGVVGSMAQFVMARVALGVGEAPTFTAAVRVIREWHATRHRSLPTGICCSAPSSIGPLIAPPLLTWLMLSCGWRWMFVILGVVGVLGAVVWFRAYRDVREFELDAEESQYLAEDGDVATRQPVRFADWRRLFGFRATWGLLVGYGGIVYLGWIYLAWLPGYLEIERHMSVAKTGIVASIPFVFGLLGTLAGGWVAEWLIARGTSPINSCRIPVVVGLLAAAACTALAAVAGSDVMAVGAICGSLFFGSCATGQSWGVISMAAPPNCTASLGGLQNFGGYLGGAMAPAVTGYVVQATGSFTPALLTGAVIALVAALMYLLVIPNRPIVLPDEAASGSRLAA
jgi:MFS family permease